MPTSREKQLKNIGIYLLPMTVKNIFPFITIPIFTRLITPEEYGTLALALIFALFMTGLANFGMTLAFERNYFQYKNDQEKVGKLLFSTIVFVLLNFVFLATLTFVFREDISSFLTKSESNSNLLFTTFCATFFFGSINQYFFIYYKNREEAASHTTNTLILSILNFILSLLFVAYLKIGVMGIVLAQLISGFFLFTIFMRRFLSIFRFSLDVGMLIESLKISYPLTPRIFLGVINTQFDKYMIGMLASVGGVGVYHISKKIGYLSFTFTTALQNVFSPHIYTKMFESGTAGGESIGKYITPFIYASTLATIVIAFFAEEIILILTPASYHDAISIIPLLAIYYGLLVFGKIGGLQITFTKKTHITSVFSFLNIALNIGLNIPLIMKYGAIGAAWATLLAGLIFTVISIMVSQRYYYINWEYRKIITMFTILFLGAISIITLRSLDYPYYYRLGIKLICFISYLYSGYRYGILSKDTYEMAVRLIRNKH
jgi:O-antigen/teichoic acid export membrane protein